jgi:hypothetical protein
MEEMNSNRTSKPPVFEDLVSKASRFGVMGWVAFFIVLIILIIQNMFYALKPEKVMATENGIVIGQVAFNETRYRSDDDVLTDLRHWVAQCVSINKISIYEDLAGCLRHMEETLADTKLQAYEKLNYASHIENYGCEKTSTEFDMEKTVLRKEQDVISADIFGDVICNIPGEKPRSQSFAATIEGVLVPKTTNKPLGLNITAYGDLE